jgi:hypothetical protein
LARPTPLLSGLKWGRLKRVGHAHFATPSYSQATKGNNFVFKTQINAYQQQKKKKKKPINVIIVQKKELQFLFAFPYIKIKIKKILRRFITLYS